MKIYHESPISIFERVQKITNGDYFLVHLFEENEKYLDLAKKSVKQKRMTILDNSVFELEEAFNGDRYISWIEKINPTWYIIPDVLDNKEKTIESYENFTRYYNNTHSKAIAVVQGSSYEELVDCYKYFNSQKNIDIIAFSFNHPFYIDDKKESPYHSMCINRPKAILKMNEDGIINRNSKHHLLGCSLPQEFKAYKDCPWIFSVDTSNPVVSGLFNTKYQDNGLDHKNSTKLFTLINSQVDSNQLDCIDFNIHKFREFCNG